jgi:hypothetical protein
VAVPGPMSLVPEGLCIGIPVLVFSSRAIALVAL